MTMTQIEDNVEALVKAVKRDSNLKDYIFVKGFNAYEHPNPLNDYLIAVSTLDAEVATRFVGDQVGENLCGSMYKVNVKFRVYAKKNEGGDGLAKICYTLCEAIKRNDTQNACEDIRTSAISFDSTASTVYREVCAQLSFCLCEEVVS